MTFGRAFFGKPKTPTEAAKPVDAAAPAPMATDNAAAAIKQEPSGTPSEATAIAVKQEAASEATPATADEPPAKRARQDTGDAADAAADGSDAWPPGKPYTQSTR